eukprot:TRINITY_DN40329_c0_g1_i1.p1 TRINITY_DN40329_c0_g1~~TRINITY_DN40329_c0_g1_i1.p1  ORF type:complete len:512 (+),score=193.18 TRINITY_DN40329_c0_g1_i1:36-1538(+)
MATGDEGVVLATLVPGRAVPDRRRRPLPEAEPPPPLSEMAVAAAAAMRQVAVTRSNTPESSAPEGNAPARLNSIRPASSAVRDDQFATTNQQQTVQPSETGRTTKRDEKKGKGAGDVWTPSLGRQDIVSMAQKWEGELDRLGDVYAIITARMQRSERRCSVLLLVCTSLSATLASYYASLSFRTSSDAPASEDALMDFEESVDLRFFIRYALLLSSLVSTFVAGYTKIKKYTERIADHAVFCNKLHNVLHELKVRREMENAELHYGRRRKKQGKSSAPDEPASCTSMNATQRPTAGSLERRMEHMGQQLQYVVGVTSALARETANTAGTMGTSPMPFVPTTKSVGGKASKEAMLEMQQKRLEDSNIWLGKMSAKYAAVLQNKPELSPAEEEIALHGIRKLQGSRLEYERAKTKIQKSLLSEDAARLHNRRVYDEKKHRPPPPEAENTGCLSRLFGRPSQPRSPRSPERPQPRLPDWPPPQDRAPQSPNRPPRAEEGFNAA